MRKIQRRTPDGKHTPEYTAWYNMRWRCENEKNYIDQGIKVCEEWQRFEKFVEDLGFRPAPGLTVDRIDSTKGYCKENCRWADRSTQAINQKIRETNKTGYRGVSVEKRTGLYIVTIWKNYYMQYVGRFTDLEEAAIAYDCAALQIHGNDARLNILEVSHV